MKALTIYQPWAHLLAVGAKRYETRGWSTRYRGLIAIHAAKQWTVRMSRQCREWPFAEILTRSGLSLAPRSVRGGFVRTHGLAFGAVLAVADLVDVVPTAELLPRLGPQEVAFGDFSHGRYAFQYENVIRLERPVLCAGRQGLFDVPAEQLDEINDQLRGVV